MNVSNNKLEIFEHLWGSYFNKSPRKYGNMYMREPKILKLP